MNLREGIPICVLLLGLILALLPMDSTADATFRTGSTNGPPHLAKDVFSFVRIQYDSEGGEGQGRYYYEERIWQRWETDFPRADLNLLLRLEQLTAFRVDRKPVVMRLTDESLFKYPFIYISDPGWQILTRDEMLALKKYLENGGFLWVDDFWGQAEWGNWEYNSTREAPDWEWVDMPTNHPILSTVFPLKSCPQIPARAFFVQYGKSYDRHWVHRKPNGGDDDMKEVHFRGLFDENGRLMAIATHNTDIADGWEREVEGKKFFEKFSVDAYAFAINVLTYVMTH